MPMDMSMISRIKNSTVALVSIDKDNKLLAIHGSGVIVDPDGYFITASHVVEQCRKFNTAQAKKGINLRMAISSCLPKNGGLTFITNSVRAHVPLGIELDEAEGIVDFDVAIGICVEKENNHPYLEIGTRTKYSITEEILMCGYPGGLRSLNPMGDLLTMRYSPVLQHGKISALTPADNAEIHHVMITDIIGTGGSSGSPLIDASDGKIVGIAQTVLMPQLVAFSEYQDSKYILKDGKLVEDEIPRKAPVSGWAKVGLVTGVCNALFGDIGNAIYQLKNGATEINVEGKHTKVVTVV